MPDITDVNTEVEDTETDTENVVSDVAGDEVPGDVIPEVIELDEEEEEEELLKYCKGYFGHWPKEEFTQDENYCDEYLKSKGLFKEKE